MHNLASRLDKMGLDYIETKTDGTRKADLTRKQFSTLLHLDDNESLTKPKCMIDLAKGQESKWEIRISKEGSGEYEISTLVL